MPKLILFSACEKALVDQHNNLSVVGVLNEIQVELEEQQIPEDIGLPIRWDIVTLWFREPADEGKQYVQSFELIGPSRKTTIGSARFALEGTYRFHRNILTTIGFPFFGPGDYALRLSLAVANEEPREVATFPMVVKTTSSRPAGGTPA